MMKEAGLNAYRFSLSWSRILPQGSLEGGINQEGIDYYSNLIDELILNGMKPFVTLFHWDVPQALEDKYEGFLDEKIVDDFKDYCEICFREFGSGVKHWITVNEPLMFSIMGYGIGTTAPGRCSASQGTCLIGDSATEPYIVSHNLILAHAAAARLYKDKFQATQKGEIGITLNCNWIMPYNSENYSDQAAALRYLDFSFGWYMDPLVCGDYPFIMRALVRERLPFFTKEESEMIKGSYDFIGINYYTACYAYSRPILPNDMPISYSLDSYVETTAEKDGVPIGPLAAGSTWIYSYPEGIKDLLVYTKQKYNNPKIYITENGTCEPNDDKIPREQALYDPARLRYLVGHLTQVRAALRVGVNVKGYFVWSLLDSFEWASGYTIRFGLSYVDYKDHLNRYPKTSLKWFANFLKG